MKLQYCIIAGIFLPIILFGSLCYVIPAFIYCKYYNYDSTTNIVELVEEITDNDGVTMFIESSDQTSIHSFKMSSYIENSKLQLKPHKMPFYCPNALINLNLIQNQSLSFTLHESSPLTLNLKLVQLNQLQISAPHFAGSIKLTNSKVNNLNISTSSQIQFQNCTVQSFTTQNSTLILLNDSYIPLQVIQSGGQYKYVQLVENKIQLINVTISSQDIVKKQQIVCVPASSVEGECFQLLNRYYTGYVGVRLYMNGNIVAEITNKQNYNPENLFSVFSQNRLIQTCYLSTKEFTKPIIIMNNLGNCTLILYEGNLPKDCL